MIEANLPETPKSDNQTRAEGISIYGDPGLVVNLLATTKLSIATMFSIIYKETNKGYQEFMYNFFFNHFFESIWGINLLKSRELLRSQYFQNKSYVGSYYWFNLNLSLKLFFYLLIKVNNNLSLRICSENISKMWYLIQIGVNLGRDIYYFLFGVDWCCFYLGLWVDLYLFGQFFGSTLTCQDFKVVKFYF